MSQYVFQHVQIYSPPTGCLPAFIDTAVLSVATLRPTGELSLENKGTASTFALLDYFLPPMASAEEKLWKQNDIVKADMLAEGWQKIYGSVYRLEISDPDPAGKTPVELLQMLAKTTYKDRLYELHRHYLQEAIKKMIEDEGIDTAKQSAHFCPKCGAKTASDDAFCRKCGHKLA